MSAIFANNLSKTYKQLFRPPVEALHHVSFTINEGEIVGLIGPNGAGKSTLMRLLLGFLTTDSGDVKLFDEHPESEEFAEKPPAWAKDIVLSCSS